MTGRPAWPGLVDLHEVVDARGALVIAETSRQLPFAVERVFFISDVPEGEPRGIHAHRECHQFLICLRGSVKAMVDDGDRREVVRLDRRSVGLYMPPLTWGTQYDYSPDAVLAVLASHPYDADDYIHGYEEFLALAAPRSRVTALPVPGSDVAGRDSAGPTRTNGVA